VFLAMILATRNFCVIRIGWYFSAENPGGRDPKSQFGKIVNFRNVLEPKNRQNPEKIGKMPKSGLKKTVLRRCKSRYFRKIGGISDFHRFCRKSGFLGEGWFFGVFWGYRKT
jgi:hypothetical protein